MGVIRISWLAAFVALLAASEAARARPRLRPVSEDDQLLYQQDDRANQQLVYVPADAYDNSYADERIDDDYVPRGAPRHQPPRVKEQPKQPPVQTIRNYNKVNDDGSFTFGYEAADGSFKEETRGTDCVVRGKYGYVDPDGNKREFTYVSGNPCDPNAPNDDENENSAESNEADDNEPANYPTRPIQPRPIQQRPVQPRPTTQRTPTTYFQNQYQNEEEQVQEEPEEEPLQHIRQRVVQYPQPARPAYAPIAITPRPIQPVTTLRSLPPPTTFRPQLLQVTPKPQITYSASPQTPIAPRPQPAYHTTPRTASIDFAAEFAKFQRENQIPSSSPAAPVRIPAKASPVPTATGNPIYSTELVYDPSSGQYDTQLYQTLPQTKGDLNLNQRLQPFVAQPQPRPFIPSQQLRAAQQPLYRPQQQAVLRSPQEVYQRQQAEQQFANSAQLFAQQQQLQQSQLQKDRAAARAQAQRIGGGSSQPQPQQFYYVAPQQESSGQIDAFLRGHGIQF